MTLIRFFEKKMIKAKILFPMKKIPLRRIIQWIVNGKRSICLSAHFLVTINWVIFFFPTLFATLYGLRELTGSFNVKPRGNSLRFWYLYRNVRWFVIHANFWFSLCNCFHWCIISGPKRLRLGWLIQKQNMLLTKSKAIGTSKSSRTRWNQKIEYGWPYIEKKGKPSAFMESSQNNT